MLHYRWLVTSAWTALAIPLSAQSTAPPAEAEVVVTGRGLDQRPGDKAIDVVRIDTDRIAQSANGRLENVLADVAGLQQFRRSDSRSANPTSQGISLRGIGGNASSRALLIFDGVPQADPFGGWVPFPAYATDRIGAIRVTRGGGSGYFGPGALAGTVELESATPVRSSASEIITYGSRDSVDARGSVALVDGAGFATVSGAYSRGDGFIPTVAESRGPADRSAPYRQFSGAFRGVIAAGDTTELQANVSAFDDRRERGTAFTTNRSQGADASLRVVGRGHWGFSALAYLQTRNFSSEFASVDAGRATATQTLDQYGTPATGLGARLEIVPPLPTGADLRVGTDVRSTTGRTQELFSYAAGRPTRRREAGGATLNYGAFADLSVARGPFTVTLGGRVDRWRITDGYLSERLLNGATVTDTDYRDREGTEWTGRIGAAWTPVPPVTLRFATYRGWRLPTLNELYRPFRLGADATAANANLSPERLSGVDAGIALKLGHGFGASVSIFDNRLDNAITNVAAGRGPGTFPGVGAVGAGGVYRIRQNLDRIRSTGMELDASWRRGPLQARVSWSHVDPRIKSGGAGAKLTGLRPAQTPRDTVSATLGWERTGWAASATVRYAARQFEDDQNSRTLAGATTADGYLSVSLTEGLALELRAENALNERVETGISGADIVERATPRTIWIGLRFAGG